MFLFGCCGCKREGALSGLKLTRVLYWVVCRLQDVGQYGSRLWVEGVMSLCFGNVFVVPGSILCGDALVSSVFYECFAGGLCVVSLVVWCWSALWMVFTLNGWLLCLGCCVCAGGVVLIQGSLW